MANTQKKNKLPVNANKRLLLDLLSLSAKKNAQFLEITPDKLFLNIHQKVVNLSGKTTPQINQELIDYLAEQSHTKLNFNQADFLTAKLKLADENLKFNLSLKFIKSRFGLPQVLIFIDQPIKPLGLQELGFWGRNLNQLCDSLVLGWGLNLISAEFHLARILAYSMAKLAAKKDSSIVFISEEPKKVPEFGNLKIFGLPEDLTSAKQLSKLIFRIKPNVLVVEKIGGNPAIADLIISLSHHGTVVIAINDFINTSSAISSLASLTRFNAGYLAESLNLIINAVAIESIAGNSAPFKPSNDNLESLQKLFKLKGADSWGDLATLGGFSFKDKPIFYSKKASGNIDGAITTINQCLVIDRSIKKLIAAEDFGYHHISSRAVNRGMLAMQYDGLIKAMRGDIALSDLLEIIKPPR